ncbi:hypothetical protein [Streptomyces europaeiscabiei]|uniref:hypothetical protein n=1 Tax=Streptomyces europaeiscabiei TaxID=146819 RepID=UPI0029B3A4F1|nr:hypothetical protein [Streptomyces europaeiscabiei]MDX3613923.1 hypothetical protein [Streptomyces europaeiscabiei]
MEGDIRRTGVGRTQHHPPSVLGASALLAERPAALAPGHLDQVWQCNSGAEAVGAARKPARAATGRRPVVSTRAVEITGLNEPSAHLHGTLSGELPAGN